MTITFAVGTQAKVTNVPFEAIVDKSTVLLKKLKDLDNDCTRQKKDNMILI